MASQDINLDPESTISVHLDNDSDNGISVENGDISDNSSVNDLDELLQDLDTEPELIERDNQQTLDDRDSTSDNDDLCIDIDNLGSDWRSPDDMHYILNKDPEWT